ncbi:hypothetical protein CF327_g5992 [Tilletia walkeri]|nr:hypothetical protein CF327_g5992 [Tilletia walkeri]
MGDGLCQVHPCHRGGAYGWSRNKGQHSGASSAPVATARLGPEVTAMTDGLSSSPAELVTLPAYSPRGILPSTATSPQSDSPVMKDLSKTIESSIFALSGELRQLSLKMFDLKEVMFKEVKTHDLFCDYFDGKKKDGWKVTRHAYKMDTAFMVEFEHRPKGFEGELKTIGFNSELDALPSIGHACGHPLIAICGVASAIATAHALEKHNLPGRVVLLGTPAEEGGGGKVILLQNKAYESMDVCLMAHPGPDSTVGSTLAVTVFKVRYKGKASHAAAAPWEGVNALDAAVQAYLNVATLRQQVPPSHRMHGVIRGDNLAVNVIPDDVVLDFNARAPTKSELRALIPRVKACFEAAATATGCTVEIDNPMVYSDLQNSSPLSESFRSIMASRYDDVFKSDDIQGSTDFGDVSYALPGLHPFYSIPLSDPKGGGNHTVAFERDARKEGAHKKTLQVAVALAATGMRVVVDEEFAGEVKETWEDWKKGRRESP